MTNTTAPAPTFSDLVALSLRNAEYLRDIRVAEVLERVEVGDFSFLVRNQAESVVRVQFRLRVLAVAVKHGPEALATLVAVALTASPRSTDPFDNAVTIAEAAEARDLLREFRKFLPADVLLERLG